MYPLACELGIGATDYWNMTFEEVMVQAEANKKNKEAERREKAMYDYSLARLLSFSFNDPGKMPKFEEAYPIAKQSELQTKTSQSGQQDWREMKARMMKRAEAIKQTKERKGVTVDGT